MRRFGRTLLPARGFVDELEVRADFAVLGRTNVPGPASPAVTGRDRTELSKLDASCCRRGEGWWDGAQLASWVWALGAN
jgi:hypothetical protein